jgi:glycosyltransferase involved in cell wall biosynthesis
MANMTKRLSTKQVKVAVDLTPMLPGGANGGIKPAILEFIQALQRLREPDFSFYFVTAALTHREVETIATERDEVICVEWHEAYAALTPTAFHEKRIDILYAPFGMIRFPDCGLPIVAMVTDLLHRDFPSSISEEERQWREEYFAETVRCAKRFQVISDYTGQRLTQHYGVPATKISRTYLTIQDRLNIPDVLPRPGNRYFFYPANFWPHKNHEVLLIAFQIYRQQADGAAWGLYLTGSEDQRCRTLKELAATLGIDDHVHFKGHVSAEELAHLFSSAGALVFPSLYEGFGIPTLEAMKLGVPVLASDAGSLREVVGDAGLLIDPRNPIKLAAAMARVASSEHLQAELRTRGFQRAMRFSFRTEIAHLAEMFVELKLGWGKRWQRGVVLGLRNGYGRARAKATNVYRFFRDRR